MSTYTEDDFTESLGCAGIKLADVDRVIAAWGEDGCCAEWSGGFLLAMRDGRLAYVWGWCDTTGWGCQDGGGVDWLDSAGVEAMLTTGTLPPFTGDSEPWDRKGPSNPALWDRDPADLNAALKGPDPESEVVR